MGSLINRKEENKGKTNKDEMAEERNVFQTRNEEIMIKVKS
jgi:hypothetical protein